jgi:hypothetical protein
MGVRPLVNRPFGDPSGRLFERFVSHLRRIAARYRVPELVGRLAWTRAKVDSCKRDYLSAALATSRARLAAAAGQKFRARKRELVEL